MDLLFGLGLTLGLVLSAGGEGMGVKESHRELEGLGTFLLNLPWSLVKDSTCRQLFLKVLSVPKPMFSSPPSCYPGPLCRGDTETQSSKAPAQVRRGEGQSEPVHRASPAP